MIQHHQLTEIIEHLRIQKKLTYASFLEDIVSERSYRRYVNEGKPFNFEVLIQLVDKLQMKMRDFIMYALNTVSVKHQEEIYLTHYLNLEMYEEAMPYLGKVSPPFYTHVGSIILPSLIKRYEWKHHKIDIHTYLHFLRSHIHIARLSSQHAIDRSTIKVLLLLLKDGFLVDQMKIIPILFDVIKEHKKIISHQIDIDMSDVTQTTADVLFSTPALKEAFQNDLESIFLFALNNVKQYHVESSFTTFFKDAIAYKFKKDDTFSSYLMYYLMSRYIENPQYKVSNDHYVMSMIPLKDIRETFNQMDFSKLFLMKEGNS
jgi:hypothetical protein